MNQVYEQHISITITKRGKSAAKLVPIEKTPVDCFGCLKDTVTIKADIINPIETEWEADARILEYSRKKYVSALKT